MATNRKFAEGNQLSVVVTAHIGAGADPASGDPVLLGDLPGVALIDEDAGGATTVQFNGVFDLAVTGRNATPADAAIAAGDIVYFDAAEDQINLDATLGVRFGYALAAVAAGATTTIPVKIGY